MRLRHAEWHADAKILNAGKSLSLYGGARKNRGSPQTCEVIDTVR
jgi:hypothetical protein